MSDLQQQNAQLVEQLEKSKLQTQLHLEQVEHLRREKSDLEKQNAAMKQMAEAANATHATEIDQQVLSEITENSLK